MQRFEYKVVPAPRKGEKARGLKSTEDRFAHALSRVMNDMAREGWDYQRTDTLPVEERAGLTGSRTIFQNMLVFRKELAPRMPAVAAGRQPATAVSVQPAAPALSAAPPTNAEVDPLDQAAKRAALSSQANGGSAPKLSLDNAASATPPLGPAASLGSAPSLGPATPSSR